MQPEAGRCVAVYSVVTTVVIAVHALLPAGTGRATLYVALELTAAGVALLAPRLHRTGRPLPWLLLGAALATSGLTSAAWYVLEAMGSDPTDVSPLYLVAYGLSIAAIGAMIRSRSPQAGVAPLLDTAIVTTGAAVILWAFVVLPAFAAAGTGSSARMMVIIYPLVSLGMLAAIVRLGFGGGRPSISLAWLGLGTGTYLAVHVLELLPGATGSHDSLRLVATAAFGLAALHPSMRHATDPTRSTAHRLERWRLAVLWLASVAAPITLLIELGTGDGGKIAVISLGSIALFTLVVARMWGLLGTVRDVLGREHEDRFRALIEHADDVVMIIHPERGLTFVSPSIERLWGWDMAQLRELGPDVAAPEDRERLIELLADIRTQPDGTLARFQGRGLHADGGWRYVSATLASHVDDPAIDGVVVTVRDITSQRELELQLTHQAFHDPLTGLPNRALFADRVAQALDSRSTDTFTAVLYLDLDDFKTINDGIGHRRGDELLRIIGQRLARSLRPEDTVARFGGDEFAVLLPRVTTLDTVTVLAERLLNALSEPIHLAHRRVEPGASLGIATSHGDPTAEELLRDADAAMYVAKRGGKGTFQVFDPTMHVGAVRRLQLKMDLHAAVSRGELGVVYQTIHDIQSGQVVGAEALLRWNHPVRGLVPPDEFIPLAEEAGSIATLGNYVLDRACEDVARFRELTGQDVYVTVNVSPVQLSDPALLSTVRAALERTGLPPSRLILELTESVFIADDDGVTATLHELSALGLKLAIDDFGTGYCSLAYLERFRFDVVKVDKSFIDVLADPEGDHRLTIGILELISSLGVPAVAEGIESVRQLAELRRIGCTYGQGFLWNRPVPIHELPIGETSLSRG